MSAGGLHNSASTPPDLKLRDHIAMARDQAVTCLASRFLVAVIGRVFECWRMHAYGPQGGHHLEAELCLLRCRQETAVTEMGLYGKQTSEIRGSSR